MKNERAKVVDPRGCPRRRSPVVIWTRVETGFPSTMELDVEKVSRAFSMESTTALLYFRVILGIEQEPLVEVMMHDAGPVEVEVAAARLAEAVKFLEEEQDIFYVNCCPTVLDIA